MFAIVAAVVGALLSAFKPRASLVAENLALQQRAAAAGSVNGGGHALRRACGAGI